MSISPAQSFLQEANAKDSAPPERSATASAPTATPVIEPSTAPPVPAAAVASPSQFSTDRQIDAHHQIYYEVVDDSTGDVLFEIPAEALRKIGESLDVPLVGEASVPSVDVKS